MQTRVLSAALLTAALLAGPAHAGGFRAEAKLAAPAAAPIKTVVKGVTWTCEGDACTGVSEQSSGLDSLMKECRKVAAAIGPLSAYASRGRELTPRNVATCNRLAGQAAPAGELATR